MMNDSRPSSSQTIALPTIEAYDLWAKTYDTDGNVLQLLDTAFVDELLPTLVNPKVQTVLDLGCGTGRNSLKLLPYHEIQKILAFDASAAMLSEAKKSLEGDPRVSFCRYDIMADQPPVESLIPTGVDAIICTLVIEHIPMLSSFFTLIRSMLRDGGWALITNMHEEMGAVTGAGFRDENGKRVTMAKYAHTSKEVEVAGKEAGLIIEGSPMVRGVVNEEHAKMLGPRALKWVGKDMLYGMIFRKRSST